MALLFQEKAVFTPFTPFIGWIRRWDGWRLRFQGLPLLQAAPPHSTAAGPHPSSRGCGGCFYFRELILASVGMVLPLYRSPRCPRQTAFGHCWLGSLPLLFTFDMVARVLLCVALCPLPSHHARVGGRGVLHSKASTISSTISSGERLVPRENGHIVAICCLMVADVLFALKQMLNCRRLWGREIRCFWLLGS